jgi:hypothetical protein
MQISPRRFSDSNPSIARLVFVAMMTVVLVGCAGSADRGQPIMAPFEKFIGDEVRSIGFAQLVDWQVLEREWVMLRVNRNRFYAVELMQPCIADVREANGLRLVQTAAGRLTTADRISIGGQGCRIARIAEFDHEGWVKASSRDPESSPRGGISVAVGAASSD